MSYRQEKKAGKVQGLAAGYDFKGKTQSEIRDIFRETLEGGMHGLCFSPYEEGQKPGDVLSEEQVARRMGIIQPHTGWVRSFSCLEGNEWIPKIAHTMGVKTLVGAWLGKDKDKNEEELQALVELAQQGFVDIAAVGNEVMYRQDLTEEELLEAIRQVREALPPDIPVGYVDAYYEFVERPRITEACDVILTNCYPYWEGCPFEYSVMYMKEMYEKAKRAGNGKKVIITETGWPSQGKGLDGAIPSVEHAMGYFINTQMWAREEDIDIFYFSSFDESWKVGDEGDVGAYWGIWDKHEKLKYSQLVELA